MVKPYYYVRPTAAGKFELVEVCPAEGRAPLVETVKAQFSKREAAERMAHVKNKYAE